MFLAGTSDDPEYEYVQLVHSDRVGWVRLSLLQPVLWSPTRLPRFHITFALFGDNLVCQLITCFDIPRADISWSGVSFAGWPPQRRPHISLNRIETTGWDAAYLERLTSDLEALYLAKTGRLLSFDCEVYRGTCWYTSIQPIIILTSLGVRHVADKHNSSDKLIYFELHSQLIRQWKCMLLLMGEVACSRNFPALRMSDLASLHLTCADYHAPTVAL